MALADIKAKIKADSQAQIKALETENDAKVLEISRKVNAEIRPFRIHMMQDSQRKNPKYCEDVR